MIPRNPDFAEGIRDSFARQGLMTHLGARLTEVSAGQVTVELTHAPQLSQQVGWFHAGATTAALDSAAGYAALSLMPPGSDVVSVAFTVNLLTPGRGERLVARATVIRSGRTITVCRADAFAVSGTSEVHCATMTATMMRVDATV